MWPRISSNNNRNNNIYYSLEWPCEIGKSGARLRDSPRGHTCNMAAACCITQCAVQKQKNKLNRTVHVCVWITRNEERGSAVVGESLSKIIDRAC